MSALHILTPTPDNYGAFNLRRTSDFQAALRQPLQVMQSAYEWLGGCVAHTNGIRSNFVREVFDVIRSKSKAEKKEKTA